MSLYEDDLEAVPDEDAAIEMVLGENPRAVELRQLIDALVLRRKAILSEASKASVAADRIKLEAKLGEIDLQLKALREEEAITTFVESSVRVTIHRTAGSPLEDPGMEFDYDE